MATVTFKGNPVQTSGNLPAKGASAPDFKLARTDLADVSLQDPSVSRVHAVLIRNDKGLWRLYDTFSKGGAWVNAKNAEDEEGAPVHSGDTIALADKELVFEDISPAKRAELEKGRTAAGRQPAGPAARRRAG